MTICIINNLYPPLARGGAEQVVEKTVDALLDSGHRVILITLGDATIPARSDHPQFTLYRYTPWNIFFYTEADRHSFFSRLVWHGIDMFFRGSSGFVRTVLQKERPDVVHTHNLMGLGFRIPHVIQSLGIRHVHTVHDVQLVEPSGIILKQKEHSFRYSGFPTRVYAFLMRRRMGSPDVVISPSNFLKTFYQQWKFFPHAQFVQLRNPMTFPITTRKRQHSGAFKFFYVGQVEVHKGIFTLIEAFLADPTLAAELHIVGDGSQLGEVRKKTSSDKRVYIHGRVSRDQLPGFFATADAVVVPSLCYENSPTVIFESFSFGVPVIASHIEGIAELINEGVEGMTFPAGDSISLGRVLTWSVVNRDRLEDMGTCTIDHFPSSSLRQYVTELEKYYRS